MSLVWSSAPHRGNSLLVFLALADWANEAGICWPSIPTIARKARISKRSAQYIIRALKEEGYISIVEGGGRSRQHLYKITVQKLHSLPDAENLHDEGGHIEKMQPSTGGVQSSAETVHPVAPDPSEKPLDKPPDNPPNYASSDEKIKVDKKRLLVYLSRMIGPLPEPKKEEAAVIWLLDNGYDVLQCEKCLDSLMNEKWRSQAVTWVIVKSQIGPWLR